MKRPMRLHKAIMAELASLAIGGAAMAAENSEAEHNAVREELEARARAMEPEAIAKKAWFVAEFCAEHDADATAYKFECRRWGDFLSVYIARLTKLDQRSVHGYGYSNNLSVKTFATSINLRDTKTITLAEGRTPDFGGDVTYHHEMRREGDEGSSNGYILGAMPAKLRKPDKGYVWEVTAEYPAGDQHRPLFELDDSEPSPHYYGRRHSWITHKLTNYPRKAEDDRIRFEGPGVTIYAPAGLGRTVEQAILREIAGAKP